ncbi:DUF4136 domain-containing protein [Maribacter sp. MMG018]|uniref:DUF4136 domain-containing protein n=1 Tax=Maribacter sp. MMG018 TaxID=2822688 RepID=UPI001B3878D1|nr:DUF4136 domain-containing protein [Maribacter sp. MMG018]MBQ4914082.1 DUF4136 domain-containing protein [Maribacter sp. MMG018]
MKPFCAILILFFITSCGAVKVNYDYEKETDFSGYSTYGYFDDMQTGLSELDEKRFLMAMDITLQSKGLKFSEESDLLIDVKSAVYEDGPKNTVGVGIGGGGRSVGGGVSMGIPVGGEKLKRELQIDFIDAKKNVLVWQAISESVFKEEDPPVVKEEKMQELVLKIFEKYPPKK